MSGVLPFPAEGTGEREVWSVGEIVSDVRFALENTYPAVWVRGEISNLRRQASGHWYFNLKDETAVLGAAMFRGDNVAVPFDPEDGLEVTALGRLTLYEAAGRFQMIVNVLEPVGWGAQQLAFEQLRRRLAAEGLLADERKRPLPLLPRCVGVVTSPDGAAWRDMQRVWERREVALDLVLSPTRVQGQGAAASIARAIERLDRHPDIELIIVARGGGSREDLWAFNEEAVARAIAACRRPVVSGVGHEIDVTIADLVADVRAATPTAAAEVVAPARSDLLDRIGALRRRCDSALGARLQRAERRLHAHTLMRALTQPSRNLEAYAQRLDTAWQRLELAVRASHAAASRRLEQSATSLSRHTPNARAARARGRMTAARARLEAAMGQRLHGRREALARAAGRTEAMSPLAVLGRGYAVCQDQAGGVVRDADQVSPGDRLRVRVAHGEIGCEVVDGDPPRGG